MLATNGGFRRWLEILDYFNPDLKVENKHTKTLTHTNTRKQAYTQTNKHPNKQTMTVSSTATLL